MPDRGDDGAGAVGGAGRAQRPTGSPCATPRLRPHRDGNRATRSRRLLAAVADSPVKDSRGVLFSFGRASNFSLSFFRSVRVENADAAASGSPFAVIAASRRSASKNPNCPIVPTPANLVVTNQTRTNSRRSLFFEVP